MTTSSLSLAYAHLEQNGYQWAALGQVYGRCHERCTLFIELDEPAAITRCWLVDPVNFEFMGPTYEIEGPWVAAVEYARHLVEQSYAQEELSGGLERSAFQVKERVALPC